MSSAARTITRPLASPLGVPSIDWDAVIAAGLDYLGNGHEGLILTEALARSGFVKVPADLRAAYEANPAAIDRWADELDTRAIVSAVRGSGAVQSYVQQLPHRVHPGVTFGAGVLAGLLIAKAL